MKAVVLALLFATLPADAQLQVQYLPDDGRSHVESNVPKKHQFSGFLTRDLVRYFQANGIPEADSVSFELLRDAPTQSGASYPKYYAWVRVSADRRLLADGAVRLVAIDGSHFNVTDYVSRSTLVMDPWGQGVFPEALLREIYERALAR